jgi:hypothetical protein
VIELNRSPRIKYDICPSYFTSFGYIEDVLANALDVGPDKIGLNRKLVKTGVATAHFAEAGQKLYFMAYPATFSFANNYQPKYENEILVPPITSLPKDSPDVKMNIEPGIYVTITGIPGLERLYRETFDLGLKLYCNDIEAVVGSIKKLPHIIPNKNIIFQFARSGWGSIWYSMFAGTPLVVPEHDPLDDPEIYFNNLAVEKMGLGIIYRGQPLKEILAQADDIRKNYDKIKKEIINRWGTLDGNKVCAELIVKDFLKL